MFRFINNFRLIVKVYPQMLILNLFPVCLFSTLGSIFIIEGDKLIVFNDRVFGRHSAIIGTIRNGVQVFILFALIVSSLFIERCYINNSSNLINFTVGFLSNNLPLFGWSAGSDDFTFILLQLGLQIHLQIIYDFSVVLPRWRLIILVQIQLSKDGLSFGLTSCNNGIVI